MKPLDPRLVATTRSVRVHLVVTIVCGAALTGLILLQAWLLARVISGAAAGGVGAGGVAAAVGAVAVLALARAALSHGAETAALGGSRTAFG